MNTRRKVDLAATADRSQTLELVHGTEGPTELVEEVGRKELSPRSLFDLGIERETDH